MKAQDIMTTAIATLPLQCTIGEALEEIARKNFQAFPVIDPAGRLRGILSVMMIVESILPAYILSGELTHVAFAPDLEEVHQKLALLRSQPIEAIMKTDPPTVSPETSFLAVRDYPSSGPGKCSNFTRNRSRCSGRPYSAFRPDHTARTPWSLTGS